MSIICVCHDFLALSFNLEVWWRHINSDKFNRITIPNTGPNLKESNVEQIYSVSDIVFSNKCNLLGVLSTSKRLFVYNLSDGSLICQHSLPRAGSKAIFSPDSQHVFVADKTGDVFVYSANNDSAKGQQILGHLSLLTDILMTPDSKYIITCDRDEKIRVSNYPGTYKIESFCMGHKEFVTSIMFLPHNSDYLISGSGDGTLKLWKYLLGKEVFSIDTSEYVENSEITKAFQDFMEKDDIKVDCLPVNHISACKLSDKSSLLGVSLHSCNDIFVYQVIEEDTSLNYNYFNKISVKSNIIGFVVLPNSLMLYTSADNMQLELWEKNISEYVFVSTELLENQDCISKKIDTNNITLLYKRKYDNIKEYQQRKKLRLGIN